MSTRCCAVHVTIYSNCSIIPPSFKFTQLHALTRAAHAYALLLTMICFHYLFPWWSYHGSSSCMAGIFMSSVKDQIAAARSWSADFSEVTLISWLALKKGFEFWSGCKCFNMGLSHLILATLKLVLHQNKFFWAHSEKFVPTVHRPATWRQISTCQWSWQGTCDYHLSCRTLYVSFAFLAYHPSHLQFKKHKVNFV